MNPADTLPDSTSTLHHAVIAGDIRTVLFLLRNQQERHHVCCIVVVGCHRLQPNELDEAGNSAVLLACEYGRFDVLLALLIVMQQGPPRLRNLNIRSQHGQTPLIVATLRAHSDCVMAVRLCIRCLDQFAVVAIWKEDAP
jgi:ankyrin repeat protein